MFRLLLLFLLFPALVAAQQERANGESFGPDNGTLMLIGGAADHAIFLKEFLHLVGGPDAPIVIIPTAAEDSYLQPGRGAEWTLNSFREYGFSDVVQLHTRDRAVADSEAFVAAIKRAKGVWISGGRQWRLMDAYAGTATLTELQNLLKRGGVIAGSSAGATIQGSFLARGDTNSNLVMKGDHKEGFGFISNVAIDQHIMSRNRQFDLFEILDDYPTMLGLGLDENTGIIVRGNRFEVLGESFVAVYDGTMWQRDKGEPYPQEPGAKQFYFLKEGDVYDMAKRKRVTVEFTRSVSCPETTLKEFAGEYTHEGGYTLTLTVKGDLLHATTSWSDDVQPLQCERSDAFFTREEGIRLVGDYNEQNELVGLRSYGTVDAYWTRVK